MSYPDGIPEQSKDLYCPEHELFNVKNAMGTFVCPFCEAATDSI